MTDVAESNRGLARASRLSLAGGVVVLLLSSVFGIFDATRFLQSYLLSYLFWLELTLGSLAMLMVGVLTKGGYFAVTRRILEASTQTIYVMAILFIPILLGVKKLYPWADATKLDLSLFPHKSIYFEPVFFSLRAVICVASWIFTAYFLLSALNGRKGASNKSALSLSAFFLLLFALSDTVAAVDWQMSLDPLWRSTIYAMVFMVGQAFGAWAFTLMIVKIMAHVYQPPVVIASKVELDLGNILLTLVVLWAYLSFMQYLIVWSGNLPDETTWFGKRMHHGWEWLLFVLFLFQFAAPFFALLLRDVKNNFVGMIAITGSVLIIRILDRFWMIMPSFNPNAVSPSLSDATLLIGIGGIWLGAFFWILNKRPTFATCHSDWPTAEVVDHAQ